MMLRLLVFPRRALLLLFMLPRLFLFLPLLLLVGVVRILLLLLLLLGGVLILLLLLLLRLWLREVLILRLLLLLCRLRLDIGSRGGEQRCTRHYVTLVLVHIARWVGVGVVSGYHYSAALGLEVA